MSITSINDLPVATIMDITNISGQAADARVCKKWCDARRLSFQFALNSFNNDPDCLLFFKDVNPNPAPNQLSKSMHQIYCNIIEVVDRADLEPAQVYFIKKTATPLFTVFNLKNLLNVIKERDLIRMFNHMTKLIPADQKPTLTGTTAEQAKQITDWMDTHDLELSKVVDILNDNNFRPTFILPQIGQFVSLRELSCHSGPVIHISEEIGKLTQLQTLTIMNTLFKDIPKSIGKLNLRNIIFPINRIITLPSEFGQLHNLRILNLANNKIQSFPQELCRLSKLQGLNLSCNQLTTLPNQFGQLTALSYLNISYNPFVCLKQEVRKFDGLISLKKVDLSGLKIRVLPIEMGQLDSLEEIIVRDNLTASRVLKAMFASYRCFYKNANWLAKHQGTIAAVAMGLIAISLQPMLQANDV